MPSVMAVKYVRIPMERVPVLIGKNGSVRKKIEELTGVRISVDSKNGEVTIDPRESKDPLYALKVEDYVRAVGRGFSPETAMPLLEGDDYYLEIIDIKEFSRSPNRIRELRGRVIGTRGKTRRLIEELADVKISVYGHTVGIIGDSISIGVGVEAVNMLLSGRMHSTVYSFLEKKSRDIKVAKTLDYVEYV